MQDARFIEGGTSIHYLEQRLAAEIRAITTRPWAIMEVCGGQTHSIIRNGIDQLQRAVIFTKRDTSCLT